MSERLPPIGFWSYATQDDDASDGKLTELRRLLRRELQAQYGRESVTIFQDVSAIPPGAQWEARIRTALSDSTFFIPLITPNFVQSEWCAREFFLFQERERQLKEIYPALAGESLIFPIYYVDIRGVEPFNSELLPEIHSRQRLDFTRLRLKDHGVETREKIAELAASICRLLRPRWEPVAAPPEPAVVSLSEVTVEAQTFRAGRAEAPVTERSIDDLAIAEPPPVSLAIAAAARRSTKAHLASRLLANMGRHRRMAAGAVISIGALLAAGGVILFREPIAQAWPDTAPVFAAIGLPVNVVGIVIERLHFEPTLQDGQAALVVSGTLRNVTNHSVDAPPLRLVLSDAQGKPVWRQLSTVSNPTIPTGQDRTFTTTILNPPLASKNLQIDFAVGGSVPKGVAPGPTAPSVQLRGPDDQAPASNAAAVSSSARDA